MSFVIDPREAAESIAIPAVSWDEVPTDGQWAGTVIADEHPQVELRRLLAYGGHVLVRMSIGAHIEREGKPPVLAGIMISADRAGAISWSYAEWYSLQRAIDEGVDKLMAEQGRVVSSLGDKLAGGMDA